MLETWSQEGDIVEANVPVSDKMECLNVPVLWKKKPALSQFKIEYSQKTAEPSSIQKDPESILDLHKISILKALRNKILKTRSNNKRA